MLENISNYIPTGIQLTYLVAASLFIIGLKQMGSPATARQGNLLGAIAMLLAVVATLLDKQVLSYGLILVAIAIGSIIGALIAYKVAMTDMPQMVGLLNGLGGLASSLVAVGAYWQVISHGQTLALADNLSIIISILIGNITFTGSMVAFAKLQGIIKGAPIRFAYQQTINILLLAAFAFGSILLIINPADLAGFIGINVVSLLVGVLFVIPIGGGDMPVVISLLNSLSGVAASAAGFVVMNNVLIISGALVGASGLILTQIMCKAMNRTLTNVLFSGFGSPVAASGDAGDNANKSVKTIDPEECAMMLGYARSVVIVPGYGMAVAQAQHAVRELSDMLERKGVEVKFAIHPVAGRMPGHMNVLLAEANVPYSQLYDMDDINTQFENTDVVLIIGANDVVNPAARTNQASPIYGMPILEVDRAKNAIVIKRGMSAGFAGVENDLFYQQKTMMLFGGAKDMVGKLANELKQI
ncbi:NAD(P) transhydrogenase, beta subunit [Pseudanabaena sp. ABRG5-3]|nr:NAD(P)(+) transhydrogenase (Re/Si-specific) subunit beta [Pseudanabaena sp. ABRG5-3]BBC22828.1 NAD(P) transhydrogenase, beta subunit [Pseudanabaena sp. ABRG5-3]